jgi:glycosyltransferase involved in cell wall biosynthesis
VAEPRPPRVLHLAQPTDGGVARCVIDIAHDQVRRGWDVTVGCPEGGVLAAGLAEAGVPRRRWDAVRAGRSAAPSQLRAVRELVRELDPDVVHLHSASAGLTGRLVLRGRRPTLFQPHGWSWQAVSGAYARAVRVWERIAARWSAVLLCVSEAERRNGEAAGVHGHFAVVPNGVNLERFPSADPLTQRRARVALGLPDVPTALCVGRFDEQKGHETALRAWPRVLSEVPAARLVLVGSGTREDALRALAVELGITDSTAFVGERSDVPAWYAASDLLVFPSLWGEGMALTPLEAMATGRPVVASDVAGVAESVAAGCGALVVPGDAAALGDEVAARLGDPMITLREGRAARSHAERALDARRSHHSIA